MRLPTQQYCKILFNSVVFLWIVRCIASCVAVCIIIALMLQVFNFCVIFAAVSVEFHLGCTHFTQWQIHVICWMFLWLTHQFSSLPSITPNVSHKIPVFLFFCSFLQGQHDLTSKSSLEEMLEKAKEQGKLQLMESFHQKDFCHYFNCQAWDE